MISNREKLIELIATKAFKYSQEPIFKLASGKISNYYVNCKMVTLDPLGMNLIGSVINDMIENRFKNASIDAVGGLTLGADPISIAVSLISYQRGTPLKAFIIRKEAKAHGLKKWVEGGVEQGEKVVIIEDVITTGMSTMIAIDRAIEAELEVMGVIALVDREEGGVENILGKHDINVLSVVKKSELLQYHKNK